MKYAAALAACALGVAGAVAIATPSPSWAAPIASNTAAVRTAASNQVTDVQYHRRGYCSRRYYGGRYFRRGYAYPPITLTPILTLISVSVSVGVVGN
jgi:hypothetical protein